MLGIVGTAAGVPVLIEIAAVLAEAGLGVRSLDLLCARVDNQVQAVRVSQARATRDGAHLHALLCAKIETIEPGFGIERIRLVATRVEPLGARPIEGELGGARPALGVVLGAEAQLVGAFLRRLGGGEGAGRGHLQREGLVGVDRRVVALGAVGVAVEGVLGGVAVELGEVGGAGAEVHACTVAAADTRASKRSAVAAQPAGLPSVRVAGAPVRSEAATKPRGVQKRVMRRAPTTRSRTAGEAGAFDMVGLGRGGG